jgi:multidrug resistance efflux pump
MEDSMFKYGLPAIAAVLLLFAVFSVARTRSVYTPAQPPKAPPVASFDEAVGGVGLVEANTENVSLSTPVSGLCAYVYVKAGDSVRTGQKLFSLDDRDLQAELRVRQSALESTRAQLERLLQSPRPEEVPVLEAKVAEAQQALADAKVQQELIESVTDKRAIREEDLQRRRIATVAAEARLNEAKADLALLKAGAWAQDLNVARVQVAVAEKEVQRVQTDIDRLTVTAPFDGQILQSNIHVGEYAEGGPLAKPLMLFGNVNILNVRVDVDEHEAWKIRADAAAYATVRGNSGIRVPLHFARVEPYVVPKKSLTGDSTERVDTRVLQVLYSFDRSEKPIYVGQQMDVFIDASPISESSTNVTPGGARR